ncbi:MAG: histidinol-phosphatase [Alphaproteobacteria bacterium]|nr:histidinol-phosphatase [Alphaproteobacteria bacterium]
MAGGAAACPPELIAFGHRLADAAGAAIRPLYRVPIAIDAKSDLSPVTAADRAAEAAMRREIATHYPAHGVVGEEFGTSRPEADYVWVLDPIDGTKSFITGKPLFGTLIGLTHRGHAVLGIMDQPISGERWVGAAGRPTTLNGAVARTRACPDLARAVLFTTAIERLPERSRAAFARLQGAVALTQYSADCYAVGLLAIGFADLVVEDDVQPYDYMALIPIVEGAGGLMTDWQGRSLGLTGDGSMLAAGDAASHRAAVEALSG